MLRVPTLVVAVLLAGCTLPAEDPAQTRAAVAGAAYPGLHALGTMRSDGGQWAVRAQAINDGPQTYRVSNICVSPWSEAMHRGTVEVQHREPMAVCLAFGLRDFVPGERLFYNTTWDGRLWDDQDGEFYEAPRGSYVWSVIATVYASGSDDGGEYERVSLDFDVEVR